MSRSRASFAVMVAGCLALVALWVSGQSFWIDECNAAVKAIQPNLSSFLAKFSAMGGSDFQMPLYMFLLWGWEKLVGSGEFALRSLNILFASSAILIVACRRTLPARFRLFWCIFASVSPMVACYMDEARPYILQFLAATLVFTPMLELRSRPILDFDVRLFSIGLILLCGSSLTGVVFSIFPFVFLCCLAAREKKIAVLSKYHLFWMFLIFVLLVPLAVFYLHTVFSGARASAMGGVSIQTILFCFYELFGFVGVGPSRIVLRTDHAQALRPFLFHISIFGSALACFAFSTIRQARRSDCFYMLGRIDIVPSLAMGIFGVLSMFFIGHVTDFRVLGRHLMPVFPVIVCLFAQFSSQVVCSRFGRFSVGFLLLAMACSSFSFRFRPDHRKDDYRSAAMVAMDALKNGKYVWWAADGAALEYYGVTNANNGTLEVVSNYSTAMLNVSPFPSLIVCSKPDVYDMYGSLTKWIGCHQFSTLYRFQSFRILEPNQALHGDIGERFIQYVQ